MRQRVLDGGGTPDYRLERTSIEGEFTYAVFARTLAGRPRPVATT